MRSIRTANGFTLIELMIVVAIIGILAAIAIPNFLKFQCKSKQSEAKTNLSSIFTAEKAFFGEYNTYSSDLISVSWQPDGAPLYIYGFSSDSSNTIPLISGYSDARDNTMLATVISSPARYSTTKCKDLGGTPMAQANLPTSAVGGQLFTAGATGDVDTDPSIATTSYDRWTMDSQKQLVVVRNDCTT